MNGVIDTIKFADSSGEKFYLYPRTLIECITNKDGDNLEDTLKKFITENIPENMGDIDLSDYVKSEELDNYLSLTPPINTIPSDADLNTYTTAGEWAITGSTVTTTLLNKPSGLTKGGRLIVQNTQNSATLYQIILSSDGIFFRYCSGGTFEEWDSYLPLTGGTVNGIINISKPDTTRAILGINNAARSVEHRVYEDGRYSVYDVTNSKHIIESQPDGTTAFNGTATNTTQLGGKGASEYLPKTGAVAESPSNSNTGMTIKSNYSTDKSFVDFISANDTVLGRIGYFGEDTPVATDKTRTINWKLLHEGNYSNYALPLTGGKLTGNLDIETLSGSAGIFTSHRTVNGEKRTAKFWNGDVYQAVIATYDGNGTAKATYEMLPSGMTVTSDGTKKTFLHSGNVGSYALPNTGGVISGALGILDGYGYLTGNSEHIGVSTYGTVGDSKNYRRLGIYNSSATGVANAGFLRDVTSGVVTEYALLHTGNKPTGSYTGTGEARTVSTGGIGNTCIIFHSAFGVSIVTAGGAICCNASGAITFLNADKLKFVNGIITMTETNSIYNNSGNSFTYQVL